MVGGVNKLTLYSKQNSLTILEITIVLSILGIILTFAVPSFYNSIQRGREKNAEFNLTVTYNAQKRYKLDNQAYYSCGSACTLGAINENLDLDINDPYYNYRIVQSGGDGFKAYAISKEGSDCFVVTQESSEVFQGACP